MWESPSHASSYPLRAPGEPLRGLHVWLPPTPWPLDLGAPPRPTSPGHHAASLEHSALETLSCCTSSCTSSHDLGEQLKKKRSFILIPHQLKKKKLNKLSTRPQCEEGKHEVRLPEKSTIIKGKRNTNVSALKQTNWKVSLLKKSVLAAMCVFLEIPSPRTCLYVHYTVL